MVICQLWAIINFLMDMAALRLGQKHAGDSHQNCDGGAVTSYGQVNWLPL